MTTSTAGHVRVRLIKTHTHAGRDHSPGDEIDAAQAIADWLQLHGIGHVVTLSKPPALGAANTDVTKTV